MRVTRVKNFFSCIGGQENAVFYIFDYQCVKIGAALFCIDWGIFYLKFVCKFLHRVYIIYYN